MSGVKCHDDRERRKGRRSHGVRDGHARRDLHSLSLVGIALTTTISLRMVDVMTTSDALPRCRSSSA